MDEYEIKQKADTILNEFNPAAPPINVEQLCKNIDINIKRIDMTDLEIKSHRQISGFIYQDKKNSQNTIYVNKYDADTRQNFTIAHELGHYFLHIPDDKNGIVISFRGTRNKREREADIFAVQLLMPDKYVRQEHNKALYPTASYLARIFNVSKIAMELRLSELELKYIG